MLHYNNTCEIIYMRIRKLQFDLETLWENGYNKIIPGLFLTMRYPKGQSIFAHSRFRDLPSLVSNTYHLNIGRIKPLKRVCFRIAGYYLKKEVVRV